MATQTVQEMKKALLGSYDEEGKPQSGIFDYVFAPGEYVKGVMAGTPGERKTGREVLENWGVAGPNQEGLDWGDVGGFALDVFNPLEPLNLLFGGGLLKSAPAIAKGIRALPKLLKAGGATAAYNAAKSALMGLPGAAKRHALGLSAGLGIPMAGAQVMNPPGEEGPDWRDLLGMGMMTLPLALPLGMAAARKMKGKKIKPSDLLAPTGETPTDEGFVYHATNLDNARAIREEGKLMPHKPWHGTDQGMWPDGSTALRSYFTPTAGNAWQFAPEQGQPVLLRVKANKYVKPEGTGDMYVERRAVPASAIEIATKDGEWIPIRKWLEGEPDAPIAEARAALQPEKPLEMP